MNNKTTYIHFKYINRLTIYVLLCDAVILNLKKNNTQLYHNIYKYVFKIGTRGITDLRK